MNGEYLDVVHNTSFESRSWEHETRDAYDDIRNPHTDLNFRVENSPMEDMNRHSVARNNAVDQIVPAQDRREGVAANRTPNPGTGPFAGTIHIEWTQAKPTNKGTTPQTHTIEFRGDARSKKKS